MKSSDIDPRIKMRVSSPSGGILRRLVSFVVALAMILAIFMITGLFLVRTEGGHEFVQSRAEAFLGMETSVQRVRIGWPYQLVLEKVNTAGMDHKRPGFKALEVRVAAAWPLALRVRVHRGVINLIRQPGGSWEPETFSRLADLPFRNVSYISEMTEQLRRRIRLEMTDCSVYWMESSGQTIAGAQGMAFDVRPVSMPGGNYYHYRLAVYNMTDPNAGQFYDMEREWLASDVKPYIELLQASRRVPTAGSGGFWEVSE